MTGKQLKNSILQWAIQGKLVPQDPNDEPASVLLERIRAEKAQLIKEGKIKKDKNESIIYRGDDNSYYEKIVATGEVKCIDEEIPFAIPKGWEWTRLGNVAELIGGYAFKSESLKGKSGTRVIRISDISESGFVNKNIVRYCGASVSDSFKIQNGDILIAMTGGTVGKSMYITNTPETLLLNQRVAAIRCSYLNTDYLDVVIKSPLVQDVVNDKKNSTNDNISMVDIYNFLIPVPPYQQQFRIILQYQKLVPFILRYKNSQKALDQLNNNIFALLKKSILQEAIQGKLVPQDPSDEPASELLKRIREEELRLVKEGKLKKKDITDSVIFKGDDNRHYEKIENAVTCIENEIPFEIPNSWQWVRVKNLVQLNPKNEAENKIDAAFIPMEKISASYDSNYTFEIAKWGTIKKGYTHFANGDVAFAKITPCFQNKKSAILEKLPNGIGAGTTELKVLRIYGETIDRWYLLYFLKSPQFIDAATFKGTANQQRIVNGYLEEKLFPLPPYNEQRRIVQRINELFSKL